MRSLVLRLAKWARGRVPRTLRATARFYRNHHYVYLPALRAPRTFNEHVHVRKLFEKDERFALYADKLRVKDIVRYELGDSWLIPTIWSGESCPEQFPAWPLPFVLKANFGSGLNKFVREPADLDWAELKRLGTEWTEKLWHAANNEDWYNAIPRRLLVEPIIGGGNLPDYKFLVFGGEVAYIQLDTDRFNAHRRTFFAPDWQRHDFSYGYPLHECEIPPPAHLGDMLRAASTLGRPFAFARVDLYDLPEGPKFGEVTFTPAMGLKHFEPFEIDMQLGRMWSDAVAR